MGVSENLLQKRALFLNLVFFFNVQFLRDQVMKLKP